jgi:CelD/BcsL family acetyltransferase involved in cellulose biosynthesis
MDVRIHEEIGAINDLAAPWRALAAEDPASTVFGEPDFVFEWWEEFGAYRQLMLMEITEGELRGIAPMSLEPGGVLMFSGEPSITDYGGPVSRPGDRDVIAATVVESALGIDGVTRLKLHGLAADSGWPEALARAAKACGLSVGESQEDICPRAVIPGTYEDYLASLPGKQRHEIRRKARRLSTAGPWTVRIADEASLDADLDAFFQMHLSSDGPKGKFLNEGMISFFRRFAHALARRGVLRLATLEVAGTPVATVYGWVEHGVWSVYNSAYDHAQRVLSPGMVLVAETFRLAAEEGCHTLDFLRGSEEYKYRFGAVDLPVVLLVASAE